MRTCRMAALVLCGCSAFRSASAQSADPNLMREVAAVRQALGRSMEALRQYAWIEQTEVFVKGKLESSTALKCRYLAGKVVKEPYEEAPEKGVSRGVSKRPMVRKKADLQDYIERAITRVHNYAPPNPETIDYLVQDGKATLGISRSGTSEVKFTHYFQAGDSMTFTYNSGSKALLRVSVVSSFGPKDPVEMEAAFEPLPDGTNHFSSATLNAKARKVEVKVRNVSYRKAGE